MLVRWGRRAAVLYIGLIAIAAIVAATSPYVIFFNIFIPVSFAEAPVGLAQIYWGFLSGFFVAASEGTSAEFVRLAAVPILVAE
jgi:hypothetical protein